MDRLLCTVDYYFSTQQGAQGAGIVFRAAASGSDGINGYYCGFTTGEIYLHKIINGKIIELKSISISGIQLNVRNSIKVCAKNNKRTINFSIRNIFDKTNKYFLFFLRKGNVIMYYKPDWDKAKERVKAFWNGEIIDRCCIAVFAPRKTSKFQSFPELQYGPWLGGLEKFSDSNQNSIIKWWTDPGENYKRMRFRFENTYFGGEAIPATYINWGAMAMASFYGSEPIFKKNTVWYLPVIKNWETWEWNFDPGINKYWQQIKSIMNLFIERSNEGYFVGTPEFGTAGDLLSLMRGPEKLAIDFIEHPLEVKKAINVIANTWIELHEEIYKMAKDINDNGSVLAWMSLWAQGRHDQLACDYSPLISPGMFKEFFVPEIKKEGNWCEYATYHLDGPAAMKTHLETLLKIEEIDNVEWTPGVGMPPTLTPEYIPAYKKIQKMKKKLYLLAKPYEIEPLLNELSPNGLFICTNVDSEDEANKLLKKLEKWSYK